MSSSPHDLSTEITFHPEHASGTGKIWKVFGILSVLTIIELVLGYVLYLKHGEWGYGAVITTKIVIGILTLAKAYYIVAYFMHLGDEIRNFIMTIIVPLALFIWFIIAFLADGESWRQLKNTNGHSRPYVEQAIPAANHGEKK